MIWKIGHTKNTEPEICTSAVKIAKWSVASCSCVIDMYFLLTKSIHCQARDEKTKIISKVISCWRNAKFSLSVLKESTATGKEILYFKLAKVRSGRYVAEVAVKAKPF